MEMLVVLTIMAVLASVAIPYAQKAMKRSKEMELMSALREIRTAIDAFHDDWKKGAISKFSDSASENGYPKNLSSLCEGAEANNITQKKIKYLRRIPRDPFFVDQSVPADQQWGMRAYDDEPDSSTWGGEDIYDVYTTCDKTALDGSKYADW